MNKQGVCSCGNTVIIPTTECIYNCGKCRQTSLFLCHIIPLPKDFVLVMCPQCQQYYTIFNCPKCQGIAALKNFKSGHTYSCTCGLQATFLYCCQCGAFLMLPSRKNYQNTKIDCKKCKRSFRFNVCKTCLETIHEKWTDLKNGNWQNHKCIKPYKQQMTNQYYPQSLQPQSINNLLYAKFVPSPYPPLPNSRSNLPKSNLNPYYTYLQYPTLNNYSNPILKPPSYQYCKICYVTYANMINTTCYHMAVCYKCSLDLHYKCPICRVAGDFKKIYKS